MSLSPEKKKKLRADAWLIGGIVCSAVILILVTSVCRLIFSPIPSEAVVLVNGTEIGRYPLSKDTKVRIPAENGYNLLEIRDGAALVTDSDCPEGICRRHFPISKAGESIVCLPHKLVIIIESE